MKQLNLGNGLWESWTYNPPLQATGIKLGTTSGSNSVRGLTFEYGGTENNGNALSQTVTGTGFASARVQTYGYDRQNRLNHADENTAWSRDFGFDVYGNNWVMQPSGIMPTAFTPQSRCAV